LDVVLNGIGGGAERRSWAIISFVSLAIVACASTVPDFGFLWGFSVTFQLMGLNSWASFSCFMVGEGYWP